MKVDEASLEWNTEKGGILYCAYPKSHFTQKMKALKLYCSVTGQFICINTKRDHRKGIKELEMPWRPFRLSLLLIAENKGLQHPQQMAAQPPLEDLQWGIYMFLVQRRNVIQSTVFTTESLSPLSPFDRIRSCLYSPKSKRLLNVELFTLPYIAQIKRKDQILAAYQLNRQATQCSGNPRGCC